jgi:hypothetical protein
MFVELEPNLFFPELRAAGTNFNYVKEISSYIQLETPASGRVVFQESVKTNYVTSQLLNTNLLSNYFTTPLRMEINPYTIATNVALNAPNTVNLTVFHRIVNGLSNTGNAGFPPGSPDPVVNYDNRTSANGLYIQMMNNPTF